VYQRSKEGSEEHLKKWSKACTSGVWNSVAWAKIQYVEEVGTGVFRFPTHCQKVSMTRRCSHL